jgi:hypothetical protein
MPFEQAKKFLARVVSWPADGEAGYINLHWTVPSNAAGKLPFWRGRPTSNLAEAIRQLEYITPKADTLGIYVCMSRQSQREEQVSPKNSRTFYVAKRDTMFAMNMKALWLDIDFKNYLTPDHAVVALGEFLSSTGLKKPTMIINSGGGLHVYWTFTRALTVDEWLVQASALAAAVRHYKLDADTQCTVNPVQVLRVPDTFNKKNATPRAVRIVGEPRDFDYIFEDFVAPLASFVGQYNPPTSVTGQLFEQDANAKIKRPHVYASNESLKTNIDQLTRPISLIAVARECPFLRDAILTGGAAMRQPEWNLGVLAMTFTDAAHKGAHAISKSHPDYSPETTEQLYARKSSERDTKGLGWPSCTAIANAGARACLACPHRNEGKSPLAFELPSPAVSFRPANAGEAPAAGGTPSAPAPIAGVSPTTGGIVLDPDQHLPKGYRHDANGYVERGIEEQDAGGGPPNVVWQRVIEYPMFNAWIQKNPRVLHFQTAFRGKPEDVTLPTGIVNSMEMRKHLHDQNIMYPSNERTIGDFFMAWINEITRAKDAVLSAPFGWMDKDGETEGFIYAGRVWKPGPTDAPAAMSNSVTARQYRPTGSRAAWVDAAPLVLGQGRLDLEVIIASAFAAPLVKFTGHSGMLLAAYSKESGANKSTALKIAQAVWGTLTGIQSLKDTSNSVMGKVGEVRSLPIYWDELKSENDAKKFVDITFQVTGGKEKSRMNSRAQQIEPGSWQTMVVSASNESLIDAVIAETPTTEAGLYRIFEYRVSPPPQTGAGRIVDHDATNKVAKLNNNYGRIGEEYAQFLGANFKAIEVTMAARALKLKARCNPITGERLWLSLMNCILTGAEFANRLKFTNFDLGAMEDFLVAELGNMRMKASNQTVDMSKAPNVMAIMSQFIGDVREKHLVITDAIVLPVGRPAGGKVASGLQVLAPHDMSRLGSVWVHYGKSDGIMRISQKRLGAWLLQNKYSRSMVEESLREHTKMQRINAKLGGGVSGIASVREFVWEIDTSFCPDLAITT